MSENTQQVVVKKDFNTFLESDKIKKQFDEVLKENRASFLASLLDLYGGDKKLQECNQSAIVMEALKAASLKLPINKSLGHAWIVAYKGVPTFQIGYKGLIQLAMRTGYYKFLNADIIYEGEYRSKNKLTGEFDLNGEAKSDTVIGFFAHLELCNGFSKTIYMTKEQIEAWGKKYSPSYGYSSSPWKKEFDKMGIKTVLKNLLSTWGYVSIEMADAMENDADFKQPIEEVVSNEIKRNANSQPLDFEEAKLVEETPTQKVDIQSVNNVEPIEANQAFESNTTEMQFPSEPPFA